jgi:hypothetical protein
MAATFDPMVWDDEKDDLSTAMGTETLIANGIAPESFDNTPKLPVRMVRGRRYLEVDQSANRRAGSKTSATWQHGLELRFIDTPKLDKHWLYSLCPLQTTMIKISSKNNSNTSAAIRYLKSIHKVSFQKKEEEDKNTENAASLSTSSPTFSIVRIFTSVSAKVIEGFKALMTRIDAENFRWFLLK